MFLEQFHFSLTYRKGSENIPADLLSRRTDYREGEDGTLESKSNSQVMLPDNCFVGGLSVVSSSLSLGIQYPRLLQTRPIGLKLYCKDTVRFWLAIMVELELMN